jgi:hypothetical protein
VARRVDLTGERRLSVVLVREREQVEEKVRSSGSTVERTVGLVGAIAAMIGIWMFHAPAGGTLTVFFWDFDVATMAEAWPFGLATVGGLAAGIGFGIDAYEAFRQEPRFTREALAAATLATLGLAAAVAYALIWIL